jgi:glycosyltransferase involved in cell wall biosynthesis
MIASYERDGGKPMKIRFFSAFQTAMATFYSDLIPFLASAENEAEVIISKAEYRDGRDLEGTIGHLAGVKIFRTAHFGLQPHNKINTALVMLLYLIHVAFYTLFGPRVDRNVFLTTPPLLPLWGYLLAKVRHQRYVVVVMDVYPDLVVEYGKMRRHALLTKLMDWLSTFALRKADTVIAIGRCMAHHLEVKGILSERLYVIPNWMNENLVHPVEHKNNQFRAKWNLNDKFVILYSGNMGRYHYFDDILIVAKSMQDRDDIAFVFIGGGARYDEIKTWIEKYQLTNILLLPYQDIHMLSHSLSAGDLHLVTLTEACTGLAVPSKSYGIFAAGRPILYQGSPDGEIARVILEEGVGAVVPLGAVEALQQCILTYMSQPDLTQRQGQKARALMEGRYSRVSALERYTKVLTHAVGEDARLALPSRG